MSLHLQFLRIERNRRKFIYKRGLLWNDLQPHVRESPSLEAFKTNYKTMAALPATHWHYDDVTMSGLASQITSLRIVYLTVYPGADQRKHQSPASLDFVRGLHRGPGIPRTNGQYRGNCFHLMTSSWMFPLLALQCLRTEWFYMWNLICAFFCICIPFVIQAILWLGLILVTFQRISLVYNFNNDNDNNLIITTL